MIKKKITIKNLTEASSRQWVTLATCCQCAKRKRDFTEFMNVQYIGNPFVPSEHGQPVARATPQTWSTELRIPIRIFHNPNHHRNLNLSVMMTFAKKIMIMRKITITN